MPSRETIPLELPPGIVKSDGPLEAMGRYVNADKIRFSDSKPQKIGGWDKLNAEALVTGIARAALGWGSSRSRTAHAIGTTKRLHSINSGDVIEDITPYDSTWIIGDASTTTSGSASVKVHHENHKRKVADTVIFSEATGAVGGITVNGSYTVTTVIDANTYTITHTSNATSTQGPGAIVKADYPHKLTAAFSAQNLSPIITVTHASHGKEPGQRVTLSDLTATVGGLPLAGTWEIDTTPSLDTYTFLHTSSATSTQNLVANATAYYTIPWLDEDPGGAFGYGVGDYGEEDYGTPRSATNLFTPPGYWTLSNFGRFLTAAPYEGTLYIWDPEDITAPRARAVAGAPLETRGMFVTPERFVLMWGCSQSASTTLDPMLIRWASQGNYTVWTPSTTNTANSRRLTEGSKIMGGGPLGDNLSLIFTDTAVYTVRYTGSRFVYETRLAGKNAGLSGPMAWAEAQGRAYWYGSGGFYAFASGIVRLPNQDDILPWLKAHLRSGYETKTIAFYNAEHDEIWWLFVTDEAAEPGVYVIYKIQDASWTPGTIEPRTAVYSPTIGGTVKPRMIGADGYVYLHERGTDADGMAMACLLETGPMQVGEGKAITPVYAFIPDFSVQSGAVDVTFEARDRARGAVIDTDGGSISETDTMLDLRVKGRVGKLRLSQSVIGGTFALGQPALEIAPTKGKR